MHAFLRKSLAAYSTEVFLTIQVVQGVLADVSIATGYVTIALMMGGRLVFDYLGWAVAAFITPTVLMLFGGAFFAFSLSGSATTASWAVFAGAITQVCQLVHPC